MTREKLKSIVTQVFEEHGYELAEDTCSITEQDGVFIITIEADSYYGDEFIEMMDDIEDYLFYEEELDVFESRCTFKQYVIKVRVCR